MGKVCYKFSPDNPGHVQRCEVDEQGRCRKNCKDVKIEALHPRFQQDWKRLQNTIKRWDPNAA